MTRRITPSASPSDDQRQAILALLARYNIRRAGNPDLRLVALMPGRPHV